MEAAKWLKGRADCTGKVAAVGFCYGGSIANMLATRLPDLSGAVPFYGGQAKAEDVPNIKAPLLLHYAENDERVNAGAGGLERLREVAADETGRAGDEDVHERTLILTESADEIHSPGGGMDPHPEAGCRRPLRALPRTAAIVLLLAAALPVPGSQIAPPAAVLSIDQVKAGQRGKGRTVFERDAIEEFDVEVLGVLNNQSPKRDVIIARLRGRIFAARGPRISWTGII